MVYDSDALAMSLYSVPLKKDNLVVIDDENEYAEELEYNPKTSKGNASIWCAAAGLENPEILKSLWAGKYAFAEDKLREIGNLLGFGETACCSPEQPEGRDGYLYKELAFYSLQEKLPPYSIITEGPPVIPVSIPSAEIKSFTQPFLKRSSCRTEDGSCSRAFPIFPSLREFG